MVIYLLRGCVAVAAIVLAVASGLSCAADSAPGPAAAPSPRVVTVFAAASTTDALTEIAAAYEHAHIGVKVRLNFASSSTLARQIEAGAPADVFLSANQEWMDYLETRALIRVASRRNLLGNILVIVTPAAKSLHITMTSEASLAGAFSGRLAVGDPAHVPAGIYAKQALEHFGWYDALKDRLLPCADVRAALTLVERGEVEAGIVYASDAVASTKVSVAGIFPDDSHEPIHYPVALGREASPEAAVFVDYLFTAESAAVFTRCGFKAEAAPGPAAAPPAAAGLLDFTEADWSALALSIKVALVATAVVAVPGMLCGWLLARRKFAGKAVLEGFLHVPLVIPPVVTGYLLLVVLGTNGFLGGWLHRALGIDLAFTWKAAVIAAGVMAFPLMVRSVRVAMELADLRLESAARTLGASPVRTFLSVTLPLALPGILGGMVLTFARSLGEFGATITFAGNLVGETRTLPLAVYSAMQSPGGNEVATRLVVVSIIIALTAMIASELLVRRARRRAEVSA
jgi:molybdate transport system permease protein